MCYGSHRLPSKAPSRAVEDLSLRLTETSRWRAQPPARRDETIRLRHGDTGLFSSPVRERWNVDVLLRLLAELLPYLHKKAVETCPFPSASNAEGELFSTSLLELYAGLQDWNKIQSRMRRRMNIKILRLDNVLRLLLSYIVSSAQRCPPLSGHIFVFWVKENVGMSMFYCDCWQNCFHICTKKAVETCPFASASDAEGELFSTSLLEFIEAFGAVAQHFKNDMIVDKIRVQMDAFLEDGSHEATISVIRALVVAVPHTTDRFRDYLLSKISQLTATPLPSSDVMCRRDRANAFCGSIRALDATGDSLNYSLVVVVSVDPDVFKAWAAAEGLEFAIVEVNSYQLEIPNKYFSLSVIEE